MSWIQKLNDIFPKMSTILKPGETKNFKLEYFEVTQEEVDRCQMIDQIHGRCEYEGFEAGTYVRLCEKANYNQWENWGIVMSDTWMEKRTNMEFYRNAKGEVLIAGLGIGMVLMGIQSKPEVKSITVIEKEQEVIDLVANQLPLNGKTKVIHADIFDFVPTKKYDAIYFDIWKDISGDNWEEMKKLRRKFQRKLNKNGWIASWRMYDCKAKARGWNYSFGG